MSLNGRSGGKNEEKISVEHLNKRLKDAKYEANFHGDALLADKAIVTTGLLDDLHKVFTLKNAKDIATVAWGLLKGQGLNDKASAPLIGSMPNTSKGRSDLVAFGVKTKYEKMLHPPLTYLGDAFQYRAADGKFNSVLHPQLGQAGAPYAKTVPSKTAPLGALPAPADIFDRLMARNTNRKSESGLSSMLIYHATIIIHDIFRTNDSDKNISDSSSYLDLSPLYGYTDEMQRKVRDDKYKLGLLKPDTFAEDRLLRQPPGVCIILVMYNRYHNYAATQLRRINENGKFSVPRKFREPKLIAIAEACVKDQDEHFRHEVSDFKAAWETYCSHGQTSTTAFERAQHRMQNMIHEKAHDKATKEKVEAFDKAYDAAWNKLDDDLFHTARLITCGMYVNVSIHDYLRALMGFHQFDTNFTLDPRVAMADHQNVSRGLGNQVTVEFNLLYRFHCAISAKDEQYAEDYMKEELSGGDRSFDPKSLTVPQFIQRMQATRGYEKGKPPIEPWQQVFGLKTQEKLRFLRNPITGLFDDQQMIDQLMAAMEDPISNFGPLNVPRCLKSVEIMGILQARKWEIGTLNDFRDFFGLKRHKDFESITKNIEVQNALRDLYDHPDKVELYPGVFCESDKDMGVDPGPSDVDSALWAAIFSDAITLVRSDRFYTVDWNTNSLTSWGMNEVTPDNSVLKSSVFHRLLQRAFPGWYPYTSIQFFHPFYTPKQNAEYARQQGYTSDFNIQCQVATRNFSGLPKSWNYNCEASKPRKPAKPLYLNDYQEVKAVLSQSTKVILHPAYLNTTLLPRKVAEVLRPGQPISKVKPNDPVMSDKLEMTTAYVTNLVREIIEREAITMNSEKPIYEIDVTRDLAIPVITRTMADFLGFGDRIRSISNTKALYSENEIYQHITNCQIFLTYNADETKLLKRRAAFKSSLQYLLELTESGSVRDANRWTMTQMFMGISHSDDAPASFMRTLGLQIAERILKQEPDPGKAAAILLLTALDVVYNAVLAFTAVLDHLLGDAYRVANPPGTPSRRGNNSWFTIQKLAFEHGKRNNKEIQNLVLEAHRLSVKLPIVRKAVKSTRIEVEGCDDIFIQEGQTIVCDTYHAMHHKPDYVPKDENLNYFSSLGQDFVHFNPKDIAITTLTAMIKVLAQTKNLRRGHDTQGQLKKIEIDQTNEGYANFMAPMRMQKIRYEAELAKKKHDGHAHDAERVFDTRVLRASTDTYLTPSWDEMVPFPTTWKVRFEGYGPSDYGGKGLPLLKVETQPDDFPPYYQPQGKSHFGGSWAEGGSGYEGETPADRVPVKLGGCGAPVGKA